MIDNEVHIGTDGWLFLLGGSNDVGQLFCDETAIQAPDCGAWVTLLGDRRARLDALNIRYIHVCIPDKLSVYRDRTASSLKLIEASPAERIFGAFLLAQTQQVVVDVLPALRAARDITKLYWKTDTHWTYAGACVAHRVLCDALNAAFPQELADRPQQDIQLTLDLGSKFNPKISEVWSAPQALIHSKQIFRNQMVRFLDILAPRYHGEMHAGASVGFHNSSPTCDPRRVLIFGDSYCEYRPHSLTGLFAETFREVRFVWSNSLDYGLIEAFKPDIVVTEIAERFIKRVPTDKLDLNALVYERISSFLNRQCCEASDAQFSWKSR